MFKRIPVLRTDEMLNKAFSRSSKIVLKRNVSQKKLLKKREMEMVSRSAEVLIASLQKVLDSYPDIRKLDDFSREMVMVVTDVGELNSELKLIRHTILSIIKVKRLSLKKMEKTKEKEKLVLLRKDAYGKIGSLMNNLEKIEHSLNAKRSKLKEIPPITSYDYTVVIAGYPNVGKSTLLARLTTSKPKIAPYPFTTTGINIGNFSLKYQRVYVIDTPGILDRPLLKRNEIELKAISAIDYLANILIFIVDVSSSRKYTVEEQRSLYNDLRNRFSMPIIVVQNKIDDSEAEDWADIGISARDGTGIDGLTSLLNKMILEDEDFRNVKRLDLPPGDTEGDDDT